MSAHGLLETHNPRTVSGWCLNQGTAGNSNVLLLYWGDTLLRAIKAEPSRRGIDRETLQPRLRFRHSLAPALVDKLPVNTMLRIVMPNGEDLPRGAGENVVPIGNATDKGERLIKLLEQGYMVDKWGSLKLPFRAMTDTQKLAFARSFEATASYFKKRFGIVVFPHYGTLLGYARGKQFIPHDDDTDSSYVIEADELEHVADHFFALVKAIKEDGHVCNAIGVGQMHVRITGEDEASDVFTSWHQSNGEFNTYFGVSGYLPGRLEYFDDKMEGVTMNIPRQYKEILALTYGPNWETPDPNFQWNAPASVKERMKALRMLGAARKNQ